MFRYSLIAASALFVCASATAQNNGPQAAKITAPVKDAGVYHMATGTWTRNTSATANIGPKVIYNNGKRMLSFQSGRQLQKPMPYINDLLIASGAEKHGA